MDGLVGSTAASPLVARYSGRKHPATQGHTRSISDSSGVSTQVSELPDIYQRRNNRQVDNDSEDRAVEQSGMPQLW